jgi:CDP-glucose 4,6-dehydratase
MIGSWLAKELLASGAHVVALIQDANPQSELLRSGDINRISVVNGELEDFGTLERAINQHEIDTVFHLGAQTIVGTAHRYPLSTFETNIRGTYNLLETCRLHRDLVQRVLIASSDKAYGTQKDLPYTEDMPLVGEFPYDVSKSCADLLSRSYYQTFQLPIAIARCGNVFGGGDLNWSRIVPGAIRAFLRSEEFVVRSDGSYVRDFIFVKDVARAYINLAESVDKQGVQGEAFNFSLEQPVSVIDLVTLIQRLTGSEKQKIKIGDTAQNEIHSQFLSSAKAHSVLGWNPDYDLEGGLRETIDWYSDYLRR